MILIQRTTENHSKKKLGNPKFVRNKISNLTQIKCYITNKISINTYHTQCRKVIKKKYISTKKFCETNKRSV